MVLRGRSSSLIDKPGKAIAFGAAEKPLPAPGSQSLDRMEQLKRLEELRATGVLSEEEFAAQKLQLLR